MQTGLHLQCFYWTDSVSNHHDFLLGKSLSLVKLVALKLSVSSLPLRLNHPNFPTSLHLLPNYGQFSKLLTWCAGLCILYPRPLERSLFREAIPFVLLTPTSNAPSLPHPQLLVLCDRATWMSLIVTSRSSCLELNSSSNHLFNFLTSVMSPMFSQTQNRLTGSVW